MSTKDIHDNQWKTRLGFAVAAIGSAVGLGNIWRFPYLAGEHGGGTFLIIYIFFVLAIGIPILLTEFSIGKAGQMDAVGTFLKLAPGTKWYLTGLMGVFAGILILSFYSVVAGWSLYYLYHYMIGDFWTEPSGGFAGAFEQWISNPWGPIVWQFLFMIATVLVIIKGVQKGIERANLVVMPALAIFMIAIAIYGLTLNNASEGLKFLFTLDWGQFGNPNVYLAALGQAFFSLSLGVSGMLTYASYLKEKDRLPATTAGIGITDTIFAIIAGIMIFPAVFSFGLSVDSGPPLVFITFPNIFASMPLGGFIGIVFFVVLVLAAFSSALSLLELPVAYIHRTIGLSRRAATILSGSIIIFIGAAASLGYGLWSGVTLIGDMNILDSLDYFTGNVMLPLGAILMALFVGWYLPKDKALAYSEIERPKLFQGWYIIIKYLVPIMILVIAITGLFFSD